MSTMNEQEARTAIELAIGRLLRLGSRPEQPGDVEQYYQCRTVVLEAAEVLGIQDAAPDPVPHRPGWNFGNHATD